MNRASKITDFSLIRKVGKGGFGEVYEARRIGNGEVVALKVIDKRKLKKELYSKVCNEIEIHQTLNYHSIVKMYECFQDVNFMYLVLEYCGNGDLHHFLKRRGKPLPEAEARDLFSQLVDAVTHLHNNNIVHRDISLNNMLLTDNMSLKLSDFGLAKRLTGPQDTHRTMCGTPNFMSPETLANAGRGFMGDCWSLGCVLYHLLTGELPFEDKGVSEILRRVKSGKFHIPGNVSVDARSLIGLLLQTDPRNRVSAEDILKHSFMLPSNQAVFSGESADSGHGTLDSNEFCVQPDLSEDEMKVNQFIPSFQLLPSQQCESKGRSYLPAIRNALRSRTRPATPPSTGPLKIPQPPADSSEISGGSETRGNGTPTRTKPPCLNTARLTPRLQQRKGLEVEICKNGSISLRRRSGVSTEEFRVSADGMEVAVVGDNNRQINMSYPTLQPRWFSRYDKLVHCVTALKSSTPKITIHSEAASAYYMENTPNPNFQVVFRDGYKLSRDNTRCTITDPEKRVTMATQHMTPCLNMSPSLQVYLDTAKLLHRQCVAVESCLESLEGAIFPVRMGHPPNKTPGNSSFTSTTTDSTHSVSYLSNLPYSIASPSVASPSVTGAGSCSPASDTCHAGSSTPIHELRRCPSVGQLCRSPLAPITPVRRAASLSPQKRFSDRSEDNKENLGRRNESLVQSEAEYLPGAGWIGRTSGGGAKLKYNDGSELILQESGQVLLKGPNGTPARLQGNAISPHKHNIDRLKRLHLSS